MQEYLEHKPSESEIANETPEQRFNKVKGKVLAYIESGLDTKSSLHKKLGGPVTYELKGLIRMFKADIDIINPTLDVLDAEENYDTNCIHIQFLDKEDELFNGTRGQYIGGLNVLRLPKDASEEEIIHEVYHLIIAHAPNIHSNTLRNLDFEEILWPQIDPVRSKRVKAMEGKTLSAKREILKTKIREGKTALSILENEIAVLMEYLTKRIQNSTHDVTPEMIEKKTELVTKRMERLTLENELATSTLYADVLTVIDGILSPEELGARMFELRYQLHKHCGVKFGDAIKQKDIHQLRKKVQFDKNDSYDILDRWDGINKQLRDKDLLDLLNKRIVQIETETKNELDQLKISLT